MTDTAVTDPRTLNIFDVAELLDELDVAGGEVTITRSFDRGRRLWTVRLLTDVNPTGQALCVAEHNGEALGLTYRNALAALRVEQTARGIR